MAQARVGSHFGHQHQSRPLSQTNYVARTAGEHVDVHELKPQYGMQVYNCADVGFGDGQSC